MKGCVFKFRLLILAMFLAGFFVFAPVPETQAATKIKTVEVYITQDTSTTDNDSIASGAGVNDAAYSDANDVVFNIKIPENTVTFRHAYIEYRTFGETAAMTSGQMKFSRCTKGATPPKAANCVATDTRTTNTTLTIGDIGDDTAESAPILLMMNIPINSDTLATGSVDYFFNGQLTGSTRTGDNAKIVITYEYSDTAATQLTTVKYGVGCADPAADAEETVLTAINPNINEDSVEILSHWVEYSYMSDDAAANDFLASSSFDTTVKGAPVVIDRANLSGHAFLILQEYASSSMDTLAERTSSHTIKLFSDLLGATGNGVRNKCAEWVVTYLFASSSATKTRTVAYFIGAQDTVTTKETMGQPAVFLPESSLTHRSVWVRYHLNTNAASTLTSTVNITGGADTTVSQAVSPATLWAGGGNRFIHDITSNFITNWANGDVVLASISSTIALDAVAELFITSSFADSSATAIKTVYWFVGQDTAQNTANTQFETTFTTYVPETVSVASRSTGIIQRSLISTPGAGTTTVNTLVDSAAKAGQDDNVDWNCAEDNESILCITGFSPSTQLTPQSAQTGVGASLSVNDIFTAGAYAYSTYEFAWSANPTFTQNDFRFYVDNNALKPTDPWGDPDLGENAVLAIVPATNDPPEAGREIRFRINIGVTANALSANSQAFELRVASASSDCTTIADANWSPVAASTSAQSSVRWQFGESTTDKTALESGTPDVVLSSSTASASYAESNPTANNPNAVPIGGFMEWDFVIKMGDLAQEAKTYCFRMEKAGGTNITYDPASFPKLETRPGTANLLRHGNVFVDEQEKGFFWAN